MAEVRLAAPVPATIVADAYDGPPGAVEFRGEPPTAVFYACPCGCGTVGYLRLRPPESPRPSWAWNGDRQRPTLHPSIHHVGHWHGWLRDGVFVQA